MAYSPLLPSPSALSRAEPEPWPKPWAYAFIAASSATCWAAMASVLNWLV